MHGSDRPLDPTTGHPGSHVPTHVSSRTTRRGLDAALPIFVLGELELIESANVTKLIHK